MAFIHVRGRQICELNLIAERTYLMDLLIGVGGVALVHQHEVQVWKAEFALLGRRCEQLHAHI